MRSPLAFIAVLLLSLIGSPAMADPLCASPESLIAMDQVQADTQAPAKGWTISLLMKLDGVGADAFVSRFNHTVMSDEVSADTVLLLQAVAKTAGPSANLHVFFLKNGCVTRIVFLARSDALKLAGKEI